MELSFLSSYRWDSQFKVSLVHLYTYVLCMYVCMYIFLLSESIFPMIKAGRDRTNIFAGKLCNFFSNNKYRGSLNSSLWPTVANRAAVHILKLTLF